MITSSSNDRVKYVRKLQTQKSLRHDDRCFVLEGVRLVEEVVRAGEIPTLVFYTEALANDGRGKALLLTLRGLGAPCTLVSESVMQDCSDTVTPQGILAVLPFPNLAPPQPPSFILIADRLQDPGNLGTLLRTALAAGVEQVLLAPGTVDFSNPKVVRSAMGAPLWLPILDADWAAIAEVVADCAVWLAAAEGSRRYTDVDWTVPTALILGSEAHGAGEEARSLAHGRVSIPMKPVVESLNAAIAAAVMMFEAARQRGLRAANSA
ncbi:MAG: RNA methyltransferase [Anaerolineae bacterium]|jgi:TrmH family RNA methyltransferase